LLQYHFYSPEHSIYNYAQAYSTVTNNEDRSYSNHAESFEPAVYIEDEMTLTDWFTANVGLRYSSVWAQNKVYHNIQPRAALRFAVGDNTSIKMSYSEMAQNNHLVSSNYLSLPTSFWMPSTDKIAPSKSRQLSAGVYFNLPHNIKFNVEGYGKTMDNLLEFRGKWGIYPPIHLWEESLVVGKGRSWGVESELSWADSKTSLTAYYTLSWSQRFFEDFYQFWYKDRNDNRHKLTLTGTRRIGKKFEVYASWNYHSGGWMTSQSQAIWEGEVGKWPEMFFSYPNNLQVPDYHRLDLGCNFHKTTKRGNESIWNLSFYNAYCRINPIIAYVAERYDFTEENLAGFNFVGQAFGIIPIIPSFSYTLKF
jgi:outer membrane receptor protein involved in Fe transport